MATSYTYATLVAALQDTVEDDGVDFAAAIPNIIALAEDRLLRDLDLEIFDVSATSTFGVASPWLAKPSDMVGLRSMYYTNTSGDFKLLEPRTWEFVKDYWPNASTTTATPKYFAEYSEDNWAIAGTPASGLTVTIRYIHRPDGLSSTTTTTWLSQKAGDLLFYACLVSAEEYLKADARVNVWMQEYMTRLGASRGELGSKKRHDYMPMVSIPTKE